MRYAALLFLAVVPLAAQVAPCVDCASMDYNITANSATACNWSGGFNSSGYPVITYGNFTVTEKFTVYCTDDRPGHNMSRYYVDTSPTLTGRGQCGPSVYWPQGFMGPTTLVCPPVMGTPSVTFTGWPYPTQNSWIFTALEWDQYNHYVWIPLAAWCSTSQTSGYVQRSCHSIWYCGAG